MRTPRRVSNADLARAVRDLAGARKMLAWERRNFNATLAAWEAQERARQARRAARKERRP